MRSDALGRGDVEEALAHLTEVSAQVLRVGRSSVWRFRHSRTELCCDDLYEIEHDRHSAGTVLRAKDTPRYFAALNQERSIAANDARRDPRTSEFTDAYLAPLGIGAMLDAPVFLQGQLVGVVCHEHLGPARQWLAWEELVAGTFADFVAMVLAAADRNDHAAELARSRAELESRVVERTQRLAASEASLRQLFNASPVAMLCVRKQDWGTLAQNRRAASLLGLDAQRSSGGALEMWAKAGERERLQLELADNPAVEHFETELFRPSGESFPAELAAQALTFDGQDAILLGIHDVSAQKEIEEKLRELATTDSLTGTLTRRRFFEVADEELARATRYGRPIALAMLDADHFKTVNDTLGHLAGDAVLEAIGAIIRRELRRVDVVGRYGGEEFVILLPETDLEAAKVTAERIRAAIEHATVETPDGASVSVTVSLGVTTRHVDEALASLIRRADEAVYAAKTAGRNRVIAS